VKDTDNDGDGKSKPFSNPNKDKPKPKFEPIMTPDQVYNASSSKTGGIVNNLAFPLSYGSADLQGFKYKDTVCLNPLMFANMAEVNPKVLNQDFCVENFKF
jgi:hypothetical protein